MAIREWITLAGAAVILISAIECNAFRHFLHLPAIVRLGTISYSTYLIHATILFTLIHFFYGKPYFAALFPVYLLVTYLASEIFYRLIEKPSLLLGRIAAARIEPRAVPNP